MTTIRHLLELGTKALARSRSGSDGTSRIVIVMGAVCRPRYSKFDLFR